MAPWPAEGGRERGGEAVRTHRAGQLNSKQSTAGGAARAVGDENSFLMVKPTLPRSSLPFLSLGGPQLSRPHSTRDRRFEVHREHLSTREQSLRCLRAVSVISRVNRRERDFSFQNIDRRRCGDKSLGNSELRSALRSPADGLMVRRWRRKEEKGGRQLA